jgi:hypothetical protein
MSVDLLAVTSSVTGSRIWTFRTGASVRGLTVVVVVVVLAGCR